LKIAVVTEVDRGAGMEKIGEEDVCVEFFVVCKEVRF